MSLRQVLSSSAIVVGLLFAGPVYSALAALDWPAYTPHAFATAQADGKTIVIVVHANWCTTCRAQEPALKKVVLLPEYKDYLLFRVDYDTQRDVMAELDVLQRSTILIFKGKEEVSRVFAVNDFEVIRDLFSFGLN